MNIGLIQRRWLLGTIWVIGFFLLAANLGFQAYFQDRIYPNVRVGRVEIGGLTRKQAESKVRAALKDYKLILKVENQSYTVEPKQFGAHYEVGLSVNDAYKLGRSDVLSLLGAWRAGQHAPLSYAYSIDHALLKKYASGFSSSQAVAPVDAGVTVENGQPKVSADKDGYGINQQLLTSTIEGGLANETPEVSVDRSPIPADISAQEAEAKAGIATKMLATKIQLTYQEKKFVPTPAQMSPWIRFTKDGANLVHSVDTVKVKDYIKSVVGKSVNVAAVNKQVNVVNGQVKSEEAGKDGLAINEDELAKVVSEAVMATKDSVIPVTTRPVAYKTIYNRTIEITEGRYIEVNLKLQHLWAYEDHKLVFDSPITSGAAGAGFATVEGLFSLYGKERNRYLNGFNLGYNYNVFVEYWMPFYKDFGLHDASWRSNFGGPDYYYNGSHGCINLPKATAAWLYGWAGIGTPVWVHR